MLDLLLTGPFAPFTLALALFAGLLAVELLALALGGSILGADADAGADLDGDAEADGAGGPMAWLGLGEVPAMIWLAAALMAFGLAGLAIQSAAGALGSPLPGWVASIPAALAALAFARGFARAFARLIPRTETSAPSARQLARRRGVVTQGTAARGHPAEVRVTDAHGNVHYLRAEPLDDADVIAQGADVLVLSDRREGGYRLVPLSEPGA